MLNNRKTSLTITQPNQKTILRTQKKEKIGFEK